MEYLEAKKEELNLKREKLLKVQAEAMTDGVLDMEKITSLTGTKEDKLNELRKMITETNQIAVEIESLQKINTIATDIPTLDMPAIHSPGKKILTLGEYFVQSPYFDSFRKNPEGVVDVQTKGRREISKRLSTILKDTVQTVQTKTLFETGAGWAPEYIRQPGYIPYPLRPVQVYDTLIQLPTQGYISYMEETTVTNAAAPRAEGGAYAEITLEQTERNQSVKSIGASIPVTDEQMADVTYVTAYINERLGWTVRNVVDTQIVTGDGTGSNLTGLLNVVGIQTQAKGTDPIPDAFRKAMTKIRVTGRSNPTNLYMHPTNWEAVRLTKTTDGIYLYGNPADPGPERLWGLPVIQTDVLPVGTGIVLDSMFVHILEKQGVIIEMGYDGNDFTTGKKHFRAGTRMMLVVYRPVAVCSVTGL